MDEVPDAIRMNTPIASGCGVRGERCAQPMPLLRKAFDGDRQLRD